MRMTACALATFTLFAATASQGRAAGDVPLPLVPRPRTVVRVTGSFTLPQTVTIAAKSAAARGVAALLEVELGKFVSVTRAAGAAGTPATIALVDAARDPQLGDEGYRLDVSSSGIRIAANGGAGLFYGVQTLGQLASDGTAAHPIPFVHIVDRPEYRWRGIHLDVSRHFFSVGVVKHYIDLAARFKLNTFHWHLTDDQGWRIEIAAYPSLTRVGGCRGGTQIGWGNVDGIPACGYYTHDQIADVVAYAAARYVTVVPEIEGPGHAVEMLAAYPRLACAPGAFATRELWGSSRYAVCPTEETFKFYDDVYREVAALFPSPVIHIGGDEVPTSSWRASSFVSGLMKREGLATYADVQSYFTRRIEGIAHKYGRRIAGWDEIGAAGVSHGAIVMAWRNKHAGAVAAANGNDVVMSPRPPLYLDLYQGSARYEPLAIGGFTTLEMVYAFDPMPAELAPAARAHIIGAEAALWTEFVPDEAQLWYMAFPRELALAELCWTPRARMRWDDFVVRSGGALARLAAEGVPFRIPEVRFHADPPATTGATVVLDDAVPGAQIRYTLDGTTPTARSPLYGAPLRVASGAAPVRIAAIALISGRASVPSFLRLDRSLVEPQVSNPGGAQRKRPR